jgi:hypothetical protein
MAKSLWIAIVAVAVVGGLWWGLGSGNNQNPSPSGSATPTAIPTAGAQGRVIFQITDPGSASIQGATAINMTVDKVEVHSAAQGWVTVSTVARKYDLLQLKSSGTAMLLADANVPAGTYDQIRLDISKVQVTANGKVSDAKLPSNTLKIVGNLTVSANQTSTASLDFMADKSLHVTSNGTFILTPVVRLETKDNASVNISSIGKVTITAGDTETDETVGTDVDGSTKVNFELNGNLDVDSYGAIHLK